MRAHLIFSLVILLALVIRARAEESPHDRVVRILSLTAPVYVPTDSTEQEENRAVAINAGLRKLWLSKSVPEKIRVCYALEILTQRLSASDLPKAYREDIMQDHKALTLYLRQLDEQEK